MALRARQLTSCAAIALAAMLTAAPALAIDPSRIQAAEQNPADWLPYHGGYKSYHYSALDHINAGNVKTLQVAWTHLQVLDVPGVDLIGRAIVIRLETAVIG